MCHSKKEHWIRDILTNDEYSTDEELVAYFVDNGLKEAYAKKRVAKRSDYRGKIVLCDNY